MRIRIDDIVAVSLMSGVKYGRVISVDKKNAIVDVGGNVVTAELRHTTRIWEKNLLENLSKKFCKQ
jgi:hypothetical protein